jgi:hypothetical protein
MGMEKAFLERKLSQTVCIFIFYMLFFNLAILINDSLFLLFKQGMPQSDYDRMLNTLFLGICSKILDCIIRFVNDPQVFNTRLSTILE